MIGETTVLDLQYSTVKYSTVRLEVKQKLSQTLRDFIIQNNLFYYHYYQRR